MLDTTAGLYPEVLEFLSQEEIEARAARARRAYSLMELGRVTRLQDQRGWRFDVRDTDGRHVGFVVGEFTLPDSRAKDIRRAIGTRLLEMLETGEIR